MKDRRKAEIDISGNLVSKSNFLRSRYFLSIHIVPEVDALRAVTPLRSLAGTVVVEGSEHQPTPLPSVRVASIQLWLQQY
jgi:hypothetical protein